MVASVVLAIILVILIVAIIVFFPMLMQVSIELSEELWNKGIGIMISLLTQDMAASGLSGSDIFSKYSIAAHIAGDTIKTVAVAIVVCLAFAELGKSMTTMLEMKRIETTVKALIRICLAWWAVENVQSLLKDVYNLTFQPIAASLSTSHGHTLSHSFTFYITGSSAGMWDQFWDTCWPTSWEASGTANTVSDLYNNIKQSADAAGTLSAVGGDIFGLVLSPIMVIVSTIVLLIFSITVMSTMLDCFVTLGQRFLRIWIHVAIAPLAISTMTCTETSFVGKQFCKSFIGLGLEAIIGIMLLLFFPGVTGLIMTLWSGTGFDPSSVWLSTSGAMGWYLNTIWGCIGLMTCFGILKQFMKSLDQFASQMLGLGGA